MSANKYAERDDIARAKAFLMGDQVARLEASGRGRSIDEKEAALEALEEAPLAVDPVVAAAAPAPLAALARAAEAPEDPVLGQLLVDLGDKRVYLTDVPKLVRLPVWEKQRVYRQDRVKLIAADKLKKRRADGGGAVSFPGVISLFERAWVPAVELGGGGGGPPSDEALAAARARYGVVDGQHRVGALRVLFGRGDFDGRVLLEVFPLASEADAADLFTDINKAEPVKEVDLPGVASDEDRDVLQKVAAALRSAYPDMFKDSTKCRKPHLNVDNLRDAVFASGILQRHGLANEEQLLAWLLVENEKLAARPDAAWLAEAAAGRKAGAGPAYEKALAKARAFGFFLGLDDSWLAS